MEWYWVHWWHSLKETSQRCSQESWFSGHHVLLCNEVFKPVSGLTSCSLYLNFHFPCATILQVWNVLYSRILTMVCYSFQESSSKDNCNFSVNIFAQRSSLHSIIVKGSYIVGCSHCGHLAFSHDNFILHCDVFVSNVLYDARAHMRSYAVITLSSVSA